MIESIFCFIALNEATRAGKGPCRKRREPCQEGIYAAESTNCGRKGEGDGCHKAMSGAGQPVGHEQREEMMLLQLLAAAANSPTHFILTGEHEW